MKRPTLKSATIGLFAIVTMTANAAGKPKPPCERCEPKEAAWDWKANGYALGSDLDDAKANALADGKRRACERSADYLAPRKLKCRYSCNAGEISNICEPSHTPRCSAGTYEGDNGMWMFVCRKALGRAGDCSVEGATKSPSWGTCDVNVRAIKRLDCRHPECHADP